MISTSPPEFLQDAVMAYPPGSQTVGRKAIRQFWEQALPTMPQF